MNIHYIENAWGHYIPVYFDKCCDTMTMLYNLEEKPNNGFWFDTQKGQLMEYSNGKVVGIVTRCWFCHKDIDLIKRELK